MNDERPEAAYDQPCPLVFVVLAVFASTLVWLCTLLVNIRMR